MKNKTVFVIIEYLCDAASIIGIYKTKELAQKELEKYYIEILDRVKNQNIYSEEILEKCYQYLIGQNELYQPIFGTFCFKDRTIEEHEFIEE